MASTVKLLLDMFILYQAFSKVFATDPVFKLIPKTSLLQLSVQSIIEIDIEMVVGATADLPVVFKINGPMTNGHAGMIVKDFTTYSRGSNVDSPDFDAVSTSKFSSKKDGLYDEGMKNFSKLERIDKSKTDTEINTAKLLAKMMVVDTPGAVTSDQLWLWVSTELGEEIVWVSEELTTIARSASDRAYLNYTVKINEFTKPFGPMLSGSINTVSGSIKHDKSSRINAYKVVFRFYFPPYAEYVAGSFVGDEKFSLGVAKFESQNNERQLIIEYLKIGITDEPSFTFHVRFKDEQLKLLGRRHFNGTLILLTSYCSKSDCDQNAVQERFAFMLVQEFKSREKIDTFKVQHVPSGRCFSYSPGLNSDKIILKAACSDEFTYDPNGGLKHIASSSCAYVDGNGEIKMLQSKCNSIDVAAIFKSADGKLMLTVPKTANSQCIVQQSSGHENEGLRNGTCTGNQINFRYLEKVASTARLPMANKVILVETSTGLISFCSRQSPLSNPTCFYKNGSASWQAFSSTLAVIKAYSPVSATFYGIHTSGKGIVGVSMNRNPSTPFQMEDSLWEIVKNQPDLISVVEISEATLKNHPVQVLTTSYAVSLSGIYEKQDAVWKIIASW